MTVHPHHRAFKLSTEIIFILVVLLVIVSIFATMLFIDRRARVAEITNLKRTLAVALAPKGASDDVGLGSLLQPVPFNTAFTIKDGNTVYELTFTKVVRGDAARKTISKTAAPGKAGDKQEPILVSTKVKVISASGTDKAPVALEFNILSNKQIIGGSDAPDPSVLSLNLASGESGEGWIAAGVFVDDKAPLIQVKLADGTSYYFATA